MSLASRPPRTPRLVAVGGLSGSGKSTLAARLAQGRSRHATESEGPVVLLRSDLVRKELAGLPATERLAAERYTPKAADRVYRELCTRAAQTLAAHGTAILDATFTQARHRRLVAETAQRAQATFFGIWIDVDERTRMDRVAARRDDASDADGSVVRAQSQAEREARGQRPWNEAGWFVIDGRGDAEATLRQANELLRAGVGSDVDVASEFDPDRGSPGSGNHP